MKILITGPTTYLTRQLVKYLSDNGHELHFRDRTTDVLIEDGTWDWRIDGGQVFSIAAPDRRPIALHPALTRWRAMRSRRQRFLDVQIAR